VVKAYFGKDAVKDLTARIYMKEKIFFN